MQHDLGHNLLVDRDIGVAVDLDFDCHYKSIVPLHKLSRDGQAKRSLGSKLGIMTDAKPKLEIEVESRKGRRRIALLITMSVPLLAVVVLSPPIPQPVEYHDFADQRPLAGIPHFWNVASNLPFAVIGLAGCAWLLRKPAWTSAFSEPWERAAYFAFFFGEFLTCFGSAYYHAAPSNATLVWDRLVFSLLLTSFFTIVIAEFVNRRVGRALLAPWALLGIFSVLSWHGTELAGRGDLRLYLVVQFYPVLAIPFIIALFRSRYTLGWMFLLTWALYGAAKICELLDRPIYDLTGVWSGHTFKHFIAAAATACVLYALRRRKVRQPQESGAVVTEVANCRAT